MAEPSAGAMMMDLAALAILHWISLHGPGGQKLEINADQISDLREPRSADHLSNEVGCVVFMTSGKFIGVVETCGEVIDKIEEVRN